MKKVIALLVVMAVFSTTVFAAPLSVAGSVDTPSKETSRIELSADTDDLFADVSAVALTTEEAQAVEGEGFLSGLAGFIGGFMGGVSGWGASTCFQYVVFGTQPPMGWAAFDSMMSSALTAGITGAMIGLAFPTL